MRSFLVHLSLRKSTVAGVTLCFALAALFGATSFLLGARAQSSSTMTGVGTWMEYTDYGASSGSNGTGGIMISGLSCVTHSGYIYCVGGQNCKPNGDPFLCSVDRTGPIISDVFYAPISPTGAVGPWTETTDYGTTSGTSGSGGLAVAFATCVEDDGYIFCIGGDINNMPFTTDQVFYAKLSSSGVGPWTQTTSYPEYDSQMACAVDNNYVYCLSGPFPSGTYYAQLYANGVGPWTMTTPYGKVSYDSNYPGVRAEGSNSCVASSGYIYCVGGFTFNPESQVWYAPVNSSGVGGWSETTDYGAQTGTNGTGGLHLYESGCAAYLGSIICVDGDLKSTQGTSDVFYAALSSTGVGHWNQTTSYGSPELASYGVSISVSGGYLIGVGGGISSVFVAPIQPTMSQSNSTSSNTSLSYMALNSSSSSRTSTVTILGTTTSTVTASLIGSKSSSVSASTASISSTFTPSANSSSFSLTSSSVNPSTKVPSFPLSDVVIVLVGIGAAMIVTATALARRDRAK